MRELYDYDVEYDFHDNEDNQKKKKRKLLLTLLAFLLFFLLWGIFLFFNFKQYSNNEPEIYFTNDRNWSGWGGLDYTKDHGEVHISRVRYMAPHIHYYFSLEEVQAVQEVAVLKVNMQLDRFMNNLFGIMTVYFPQGNICVAVDREGRVAIVTDPEGEPVFSNRRIQLGEKHDIYLLLDSYKGEVTAYIDGRKAVTVERFFDFYPLTDVWLGSPWIGGNNHFGAPLGFTVRDFNIGDENLLTHDRSFLDFLGIYLTENYWRWLIPFILFIIIFFAVRIVNNIIREKSERGGSYSH